MRRLKEQNARMKKKEKIKVRNDQYEEFEEEFEQVWHMGNFSLMRWRFREKSFRNMELLEGFCWWFWLGFILPIRKAKLIELTNIIYFIKLPNCIKNYNFFINIIYLFGSCKLYFLVSVLLHFKFCKTNLKHGIQLLQLFYESIYVFQLMTIYQTIQKLKY